MWKEYKLVNFDNLNNFIDQYLMWLWEHKEPLSNKQMVPGNFLQKRTTLVITGTILATNSLHILDDLLESVESIGIWSIWKINENNS